MADSGYRKKDPSFCANCGARVTNAGRASRHGERFCKKRECQAAKARRHREYAASLRTDRPAPAACAGCGAGLPERSWRAGDDLGRWCRKVTCRRKRDQIRSEANLERLPDTLSRVELLETALEFLGDAIRADDEHTFSHDRAICRQCGLENAIRGWMHQSEDGRGCRGTLDGQPMRKFAPQYLVYAWPSGRRYLDAETLAKLAAD